MAPENPVEHYSKEQRELWTRVCALWALSKARDAERIRAALHPRYVGWDMNASAPHEREAAVQSVLGDTPALGDYELHPLRVEVYDAKVGVAHYAYRATILPAGKPALTVNGRWSEVYLKQGGEWLMVSVSGKPEAPREIGI